MRVSRLQLQGFKSFSGRVQLELGPGITAIVGPNGSGKSNLVDAIRLVLGETSARELRGQRLDQVIFAGGANRAPVGMAEVEMVFDNDDGRLPVEDLEVAISRRVFRDGSSEFRRNGHRVRLRDLTRLLDATGLTQVGYSVIAQNDIESIIRATPGQRRHLIEEAAGVRAAQALIEDAGARLSSLAEWLDGSTGRLAELLPRIESLRQEAAVADEAAELRSRLRRLRGSLERGAWLAALADQRRLERQLQAAVRRAEQLRLQAEDFERGYRADRERFRAIAAGRIEAERLAGGRALALQEAQAGVDRWQDRLAQATEAMGAAERARDEAGEDLAALLGEGEDAPGVPAALERGRSRVLELAGELAGLRAQRAGQQAELAASQARSREIELGVAGAGRRRSELEAALAGAEAFREQARTALAAAAEERSRAAAELEQATAAVREAGLAAGQEAAALERARRAEASQAELAKRAEEQLSRATVALREAEARQGARAAALESRSESAPIAGAVAQGRSRLRRLAEGVRTGQAGDSAAVEAGLGALLGALVGEEAEVRQALRGAGELPELVCWPVSSEPAVANPPEGCRALATVLEGDPASLAVVARLTRLVCLARDRESAARWLARFPDGRSVLPDGAVIGTGMEITPARSEGELRAVELLREASRSVELRRAEQARAEERLGRAREAQLQQRAVVDQHRERAAAASAAAGAARLEDTRLRTVVQRAEQALAGLGRELEEREQRSSRDAAALSALVVELEVQEAEAAAATAGLESLRRRLAELDQQTVTAGQRLEEARLEIAGLEAEARAAVRRQDELGRRREQLSARERAAAERVEAARALGLEAGQRLADSRAEVERASAEVEAARARRAEQAEDEVDPIRALSELERRHAELEEAQRSAAVSVESLRRELGIEVQKVERLRSALEESLGGDPGEDQADPQDSVRAAQEIARLERRLSAIGPINELAPSQLAQLLARTEGLRSAHQDCLQSRSELDQVLGRLQELSGARFQETLKQVTREFESVWPELFGGGRATLVATPGENGSPSGVDLEVQPQGKRPIQMALLSGGERAMTALALVLALQQVSPSPFYVFDEVDASLDETNIIQFAKLLQRRSEKSQFLVITHNLSTMALASLLYGVTQDGHGSSRLLSVRLREDGRSLQTQNGVELESVAVGG